MTKNDKKQKELGGKMNFIEEIVYINTDTIKPDPNQPRKVNAEDPATKEAIEGYAATYKTQGQISPIEIDEDNQIIMGELRWRAAKLAKLKTVKCVVKIGLTKEEKLERQLIENFQRKNLELSEAIGGLRTLIKKYGSQNKVAKRLGINQSYISHLLEIEE